MHGRLVTERPTESHRPSADFVENGLANVAAWQHFTSDCFDKEHKDWTEEHRYLDGWLSFGAQQPVEDGSERQIEREKQKQHLVSFTPVLYNHTCLLSTSIY